REPAQAPNVPDPSLDRLEPDRAHRADCEGNDFRVGGQGGPADDLRVDLGELAVPSLLRLLVPEDVARAVQLERLRATAEIGDVEPEDRSGEFRPQCEVPAALVLERVEFADDRRTGFRGEELEALEGRGRDLAEAERFGELDEPRLDEASLRHVLATPVVGPAGPVKYPRRGVDDDRR